MLLLLVAAPGLAFILQAGMTERGQYAETSRERSERFTAAIASTQRAMVEDARANLSALASKPAVKDPEKAGCGVSLAKLISADPRFAAISVALSDGRTVCTSRERAGPSDPQIADLVASVLEVGDLATGIVRTDAPEEQDRIAFAYPVTGPDAGIAGVLVAEPGEAFWMRHLEGLDLPATCVVEIADGRGRGLVRILAGDVAETDGGANQRAWKFIPETPAADAGDGALVLRVGFPADSPFLVSHWQSLLPLAGYAAAVILAWAIAGRAIDRQIVRPVRTLADDAGRSGHTTDSTIASGISEIDRLGQTFQSLTGARRAAEHAERRRRDEISALLDALPDLCFRLDGAGRIVDWQGGNRADLLTVPDHFLGQKLGDVLPPEAAAICERNMRRHRQSGDVVSWEYSLEFDGEDRFFEARACPIVEESGSIIVVRNITERKKDMDLLRLAGLVYEASSEGMIVTDAAGVIETVNPAISEVTGNPLERLRGRHVGDLVAAEDRVEFRADLDASNGNGLSPAWKGEVRLARSDGGIFPAWLTVNDISTDDTATRRRVFLLRDMTELKAASEAVLEQARTDTLTNLPNRSGLTTELEARCCAAQRAGESLALLFLDIDRLKQVNDRFGHQAGDAVLVQVARRLERCLGPDDFLARQAGDEFVVLLQGPSLETQAEAVAERILAEVSRPYPIGEDSARLSGSLGIALFPRDTEEPHALLTAADQAMHVAKAEGRNRARLFTPKIRQVALDRIRLIDELHRGLEAGQFELHYQPIVDLASGEVAKAEALLRWQHPDFGPISPVRFVPLAEQARLIGPLGDWSLQRAIADLPELRAHFGPSFQVSLNLSPVQLAGDPGLEGLDWSAAISAAGLAPGSLVVEVTEGALLDPDPRVAERLSALRAAGALVALDDFGTGYSSMLYFLHHDFDYLKIDREFVRGLSAPGKAAVLCESMLQMARRLGCRVIAEGIETPSQLAALKHAGCEFGQGFYFSSAQPLHEILKFARVLKAG